MYRILLLVSALAFAGASFLVSCQHDPYFILVNNAQDTTDTGKDDTNNDTTFLGIACNPDTVYFDNTILPLLVSNCSMSGCHDAASHKEDVILTSYSTIRNTGKIKLSKPSESELYRILLKSDPEDRMPQGKPPLLPEQITQILKWIEQGALDNYCDECDSAQASYALNIQPIIRNSCQGCHSGTTPSGNLDLSNYAGLKSVADNGRLIGAVSRLAGYKPMPESSKLPDCDIGKIRVWISAGSPNN